MSHVSGPCSSLPGSVHTAEGMCDEHSDRPAVKRVQGETDSFGAEYIDMCQECFDKYKKENAEQDTSGCCDWCNKHKPALRPRRDMDEGMSGRVYQVCADCIRAEALALIDDADESDFEPYYGDDD